jgi:hypothetical protein
VPGDTLIKLARDATHRGFVADVCGTEATGGEAAEIFRGIGDNDRLN